MAAPTLEISFDTNLPQVGPDAGVPITLSGTYLVSGADSTVDSVDASLTLSGSAASVNYAVTLNNDGTFSSTLITPFGGALTAVVTLVVVYEKLVGNPKDPGSISITVRKSATANLGVSASNVQLQVTAPTEGQLIIGAPNGTTINATGTASSKSTNLTVGTLTWQVAGASGTPTSPPPYTNWNAIIALPPGRSTILFTAKDTASPAPGVARQAVDVQVAELAKIFDVSPSSYLQALEELAAQPVTYPLSPGIAITGPAGTRSATVTDLENALVQHLQELQLGELAKKANEPLLQTRACIEVLRNYLSLRFRGPVQVAEEGAYRRAAYEALLLQIGTSATEVRIARSYGPADQDRRWALAGRLGIDLGPTRPDNLDALVLDPSAAVTQANAVTEEALERLFGLASTDRDPLSNGLTISTSQAAPTLWQLDGVQWAVNTDPEGLVYCSIQQPAPGTPSFQVNLYSSSSMAASSLVASGSGNEKITLYSAGNSGLTGHVWLAAAPVSTCQFSVIPRYLSWQFRHLRTLWAAQDFPTTAPAGALPLVDPDLLVTGDFVHPATNPAYTLYEARRAQVQTWLATLKQAQTTGLDAVLQAGIQKKSADLLALDAELKSGQDITAQLAAVNLSLDAFSYLVRMCNLGGQQLLSVEWDDVFSILIQALKQGQYAAWRAAEQTQGLTLGPDYFAYPSRLPDLFGTGVDQTASLLINGAVDPNWTTSSPTRPQGLPTYATTIQPNVWLPNSITSRWISPQADETVGDAPGAYTYLTRFDLGGFDPSTVKITAQVAVDNDLMAVILNGNTVLGLKASGYTSFTTLEITDGFVAGVNLLGFVVYNEGTVVNPSGLRVELSLSSSPTSAAPDPWRAPASARAAWQATLEGRIGQQQRLTESLQDAVLAAEEETLPLLRKALVNAATQYSPFTGLCSTGVDAKAVPITGGAAQSIWKITANPAGSVSANAFVTQNPNALWTPNTITAQWISPSASETPGDAPGPYTYETDFQINGFDLTTVQLNANISADDTVTAMRLNGQNVPIPGGIGFAATTPITIASGFVEGNNKLEIVVTNAGTTPNPTGLRVEFLVGPETVDEEWLAERLLIDLSGSPTQMTTRLTLAIESMQGLFSALYDAIFQQMSPQPDLVSWQINNLASFGGYWNWESSYATWRATMLSFLYPENLLKPSLLPGSHWSPTTPFTNLLGRLRAAASITRFGATSQANQYLTDLRSGTTDASGNPVNLLPSLPSNFTYTDPGDADLGQLRLISSQMSPPAGSPYLMAYWEVFYFVPVQLALQLQQAGQYEAALDWLRTVYDIDRPLVQEAGQWSDDNRKIFFGLLAEKSANPQFIVIPGSLVEDSNPHDVAVTRVYPYARFTFLSIIGCLLDLGDVQFSREAGESVSYARELYQESLSRLNEFAELIAPVPGLGPNPQLAALQQRAENNLAKMRSNRNIAGLVLQFDLFGAQGLETVADRRVSLEPTQYRYATLIDRAKQLTTLAQQVETTYLGALANADTETYNLMKAQGDLNVANATVTLLADQVTSATDSVTVAKDQAARAKDEQTHYQDLINAGLNEQELQGLQAQQNAMTESAVGATLSYVLAGAVSGLTGLVSGISGLFSGFSQAENMQAQYFATQASYERREQDWEFQLQLSKDDIQTTKDQTQVANDQLDVVKQQQQISAIQQTNARDIVNFLASKFTNADLYDWMTGVLGQTYRFFLQQATSMARLAEDQLAFERQQRGLSVIQPEYWVPLSDLSTGGQTSSDRRGLTGAERLLADITQLDQYAFETDTRKLQLTKTISLSQLDPFAFQRFRYTGVLVFNTPESLFDHDFPGHYVRLISTVRTTVVALVPPAVGIRATLSNKGLSRVVAGVPLFRQVIVQRDPEQVALSAPYNATGLFELDPQSQLLRPFENMGVDTSWRFEMPKAANPLDYGSLADVLFSIDYTALYDTQYRDEVLQQLDRGVGADRGYSFRQDFADAWYDLNNEDTTKTTVTVTFSTEASDLPPNVENLAMAQLILYFVRADGASFEVQVNDLQFTPQGAAAALDGGAATSLNGVISTRRANGDGWKTKFLNPAAPVVPFGQWQLTLPNTTQTRAWFANQQIEDILFVITYSGQTPAWPS